MAVIGRIVCCAIVAVVLQLIAGAVAFAFDVTSKQYLIGIGGVAGIVFSSALDVIWGTPTADAGHR